MKYNIEENFEKLAETKAAQESNHQSTENDGEIFSVNKKIAKEVEDKIKEIESHEKEISEMRQKVNKLGYTELSAKEYLEGLESTGWPLELSYTKKFIEELKKKAGNGEMIKIINNEKQELIINKANEILLNENQLESFFEKEIKPLERSSFELENLKIIYEYCIDFISKIMNHSSMEECKKKINNFFKKEIKRAKAEENKKEKKEKEAEDYKNLPFYKKLFAKNSKKKEVSREIKSSP